jgi:predicted lipid-binding transport protein (Tim44 family)
MGDAPKAALAGVVAGGLIGGLLCGVGHGVVIIDLMLAGAIVLLMFLRRRRAVTAASPCALADVSSAVETASRGAAAGSPHGGSSLDRGVRDIRGTDPGFDPSRFAGYAAMTFRDTQSARMARDVGSLRDRVTSEMRRRLQAQYDRLRSAGQTHCVEQIDINAEVSEAWQESGRDYVTAYISGSLVDYAIDQTSGSVIAGSRTHPRPVEEFWTFTRPAGLNFWMLSMIQHLTMGTGDDPADARVPEGV